MTAETKISINLSGLEEIKKQVGNTYRTRVGVLGSDAARNSDSGINNATLMLIQMFGSVSRNIPARDPLFQPLIRHRRELIRALGGGKSKDAFARRDFKKLFQLLGVAAEAIVQNAFETSGDGQWPPNKPATIRAKGSSKPLINTAQMRRAVSSDVVKKASSGGRALTKVTS